MDRNRIITFMGQRLSRIGYSCDNLEHDYPYMANNKKQEVDILAFSNPYRKDFSTACIVVKYCNSTELDKYKAILPFTAALIAFLVTPDFIEIQPLSFQKKIDAQKRKYDEFENYIESNRVNFLPNTLQAVKHYGRQLSLFELDPSLYEYVSEISKKDLVSRFEGAIKTSLNRLGRIRNVNQKDSKILTTLAIKLLAARVLEDKQIFRDSPISSNALNLLSKANKKFPEYFSLRDIKKIGEDVYNIILEQLGRDYTYRNITNDLLGYFYEQTFVSEQLRKSLGIYFTPEKIAKEMLKTLPIEQIHPNKRYVLDGTCGSGSLLTAAFHRLYELLPQNWDRNKKHIYLSKHIMGFDKDQFAVEIAKKSLLLASLPVGNSWNINHKNFLDIDFKKHPLTPYIIVANPPFKETNKEKLSQEATKFLDRYISILPEGGLISVVLPESYFETISCRSSRNLLLSNVEILEIWQLPEGSFKVAHFPATVITGKKKKNTINRPVRIKRLLQPKEVLEKRFNNINFDYSYISNEHSRWVDDNNKEIKFSAFQDIWEKLYKLPRLGQFYWVRTGMDIGYEGRNDLSFTQVPGSYKYLNGATFIEPYSVLWEDQKYKEIPLYLAEYPGNIRRPCTDLKEIFESKNKKILINSARSPANPWCLYATIDREGYFPSCGLKCIYKKIKNTPELEVLVAVLNSYVANAFLDSFSRKRKILKKAIENIPIPFFTQNQKGEVVKLVREIEENKNSISQNKKASFLNHKPIKQNYNKNLQEKINKLDEIIFNAYGLLDCEQKRIKALFRIFNRPGSELENHKKHKKEMLASGEEHKNEKWKVTGKILNIDSHTQTINIWLLGFDKPAKIFIPQNLPGWALKNDIDFDAIIPRDQRNEREIEKLKFIEFFPKKSSYLTDDEIEQIMIKKLKENDKT
jgi:hypothetical protein